jgi:hypothetical protein
MVGASIGFGSTGGFSVAATVGPPQAVSTNTSTMNNTKIVDFLNMFPPVSFNILYRL